MNNVTVTEIPNAWGWYGRTDQTAYEVCVNGELWARVCYRSMARDLAERLRSGTVMSRECFTP